MLKLKNLHTEEVRDTHTDDDHIACWSIGLQMAFYSDQAIMPVSGTFEADSRFWWQGNKSLVSSASFHSRIKNPVAAFVYKQP